jgi:hypothetical protein
MDQGPKDSTPCNDLAKVMPELESGLKPVADQLQPTLNCKDQLLDLVMNFITEFDFEHTFRANNIRSF